MSLKDDHLKSGVLNQCSKSLNLNEQQGCYYITKFRSRPFEICATYSTNALSISNPFSTSSFNMNDFKMKLTIIRRSRSAKCYALLQGMGWGVEYNIDLYSCSVLHKIKSKNLQVNSKNISKLYYKQ